MKTLLIAAALFAPGSAWAANGDIGCIEAKLGPAAMQRIGARVVAAVEAGKAGDPIADDRDALLAARAACQDANGWSGNATQLAVSYALATATRQGAEPVLKRNGFDPVALATRYSAMAAVDRRSMVDGDPSNKAKDAVAVAAVDPKRKYLVMLWFSTLAALEFDKADFAAA